jgi:hypothetical protein
VLGPICLHWVSDAYAASRPYSESSNTVPTVPVTVPGPLPFFHPPRGLRLQLPPGLHSFFHVTPVAEASTRWPTFHLEQPLPQAEGVQGGLQGV